MTQLSYYIKYRIVNPRYKEVAAPEFTRLFKTKWIDKSDCFDGRNEFCFLNQKGCFSNWSDLRHGALWAYNQNYFDFINQKNLLKQEASRWIDKFISEMSDNSIGLAPYPTALRCINWIKFFCQQPDCAIKSRIDSLYSQVKLLNKKLEYHLLGNHLLEDAYALYISSLFFKDNCLYQKAWKLLKKELSEQILPDGAHYEQAPMYHCILLDRLLDCINFDNGKNDFLKKAATMMLGHMENIVWMDGTIPLLNDTAYGIAPAPKELFNYARRLGLEWIPIPLKECGYRKLKSESIEVFIDVGNITASYQPGHSHADTFSYELRIFSKPFIVDTGISTYEKNDRRQYERSTAAHNTVTINNKDSSEVWGGFRMGRRCQVKISSETKSTIIAQHNGFGKSHLHQRKFEVTDQALLINDRIKGCGISHMHLSPNVKILAYNNIEIKTNLGIILLEGADNVEVSNGKVSTEYNSLKDNLYIKVFFKDNLYTTISINNYNDFSCKFINTSVNPQ